MTQQDIDILIAEYEATQADEWAAYELGDCGE